MKLKVLKEEIVWTLFILGTVAAVVLYLPSEKRWGLRVIDQVLRQARPLEGNLITIGSPTVLSVTIPNFENWELTSIDSNHVTISRDHERAPLLAEITVEEEPDTPQPKSFKAFQKYIQNIEAQYKRLGYTIMRSKPIYVHNLRWAAIEMQGWKPNSQTNVYIHRSAHYVYKITVDYPTSKGFNPANSRQCGIDILFSTKVLD